MKTLTFFLLLISCVRVDYSLAFTSFETTLECPVDGKKFKTYLTGSYSTFGALRDFEKTGAVGNLYETYIHSCPKCYYSAYQSDFDTTFTDETKEELRLVLAPFSDTNMTPDMENWVAAEVYKYFGFDNDRIANIYLTGSYILRGEKNKQESRKEFQREAIIYFLKAIEAGEYEGSLNATIYYLIAELYRRSGDFETAITYFDKAIAHNPQEEWLEPLTKEQRQMAVDKNDDNHIEFQLAINNE